MHSFDTAGPCIPEDHWMPPAAESLEDVPRIIDRKGDFGLHAHEAEEIPIGRQDTYLDRLAERLRE